MCVLGGGGELCFLLAPLGCAEVTVAINGSNWVI